MTQDKDIPRLVDNPALNRRYVRTLQFMRETLPPPARLLYLGAPNPFSHIMQEQGYAVQNTEGDLDETPEVVQGRDVEAVTAFEILEHLVGPLNVSRAIDAPWLIATVPLQLWFARSYYNPNDPWDRHFHEFEDWQFDWLLEKAGWRIVQSEKWTSPSRVLGFCPLLRWITPRYYAVEAVRA